MNALVGVGAHGVATGLEEIAAHLLAIAALGIPTRNDLVKQAVVLRLGQTRRPTEAVALEAGREDTCANGGTVGREARRTMILEGRQRRLNKAEQRIDGQRA